MLRIDINPSRQFIVLMWIILICSEATLFYLSAHYVLRGILGLVIFVYWYHIYKKHALLKHPQSLIRLERQNEADWKIVTRQEEFFAKILGSSTLTTKLCVLRFEKVGGGKCEYVIFADSVGKENFRQLIFEVRKK